MHILPFLASLILLSCASTTDNVTTEESIEQTTKAEIELVEDTILPPPPDDHSYEEFQDSLRTVLLNSKSDERLKSSFLVELYLRGMAKQENGQLKFFLPFNLHGIFDCGSPDCYSTDISFEFPTSKSLTFPEKIPFTLHEHGCYVEPVDGIEKKAVFKRLEQTKDAVVLYCASEKSSLVIATKSKTEFYIYYFTLVGPNDIRINTVSKVLQSYRGDETDIRPEPYSITSMNRTDYEQLLDQN